jgi:NAD(P)-dependent dehydrogenase (short-subunit alcohol dehydrogenase family)
MSTPAMPMSPRFDGHTVLVTGGASGLGAEICRTLAAAGAHVIAADVQCGLLESRIREVRASGGSIEAAELDVCDERAIEALVNDIRLRHGRLDVLINNAGTDKTLGIEELSVAEIDRVLDVNLRGPFVLSKFAFAVMRAQASGYIINIVSTAAKRAWANASAYHASKWGLLGLSHALHVEARVHGIKVTALLLGGMRTPFILDRFPDTPLRNLQDPKDVAETVKFLLAMPAESVLPELLMVPLHETSWP